ncbi:MAG: bifunctional metallophosphatase/5'-nucleotidase [Burkholderiaceae bacterium]
MFMRRIGSLLTSLVLAGCASVSQAPVAADQPLKVKLIAFNDFHGNLEPPGFIRAPADGLAPDATPLDVNVPAGGVARFATLVKQLSARNPNHAIVSAGDMIGASPLVSALFLDEPTIEAMNMIGVDFNSVGNHEFDRGVAELKRKQTGGCERYVVSLEPCRGGHRFEGAKFQYLVANVIDKATGQPIFPAYGIKSFEGVRIGFIGLTLKGTDQIVDPTGIAGVEFRDEATTINARGADLRAQGVNAIVVLIHQGGYSKARLNEKTCPGLTGDILPILDRLDPSIDVVASAHTHQPYVCTYRSFLLTSAASYGRLITDIDLAIDRRTGRVLQKSAVNRVVASEGYGEFNEQAGYPPLDEDPAIADHVGGYVRSVAPFANRKVGITTGVLSNREDASGQSPLGSILADADLQATLGEGARIALLNPGSVRAPIDNGFDGTVTYGALFRSQPFGNNLITMTLSGAQIKALLEQQWLPDRQQVQILQVSQNFRYSYDLHRSMGSRILFDTIRIDGQPIDAGADYRVTVNSFMASGGDGFTVLIDGRGKQTGIIDVDAAEAYFTSHSPMSPPAAGRIRSLKN